MTPAVLVVKAKLGDDLRKFKLCLVCDVAADFEALGAMLRDTFQLEDGYRIKYKDDEDWVSMVTNEDFKECVKEHLDEKRTLYLSIHPKSVASRSLSVTTTQSSIAGSVTSTATSQIPDLLDSMNLDDVDSAAAAAPSPLQPDEIEIPAGPVHGEEVADLLMDCTDPVRDEAASVLVKIEECPQSEGETLLPDRVEFEDTEKTNSPPEIIECPEPVVCEEAETADDATPPPEAEATVTDVDKALMFVRMVQEKFKGDERAQHFIKIGADFHDKRISRQVFHEACLGLFADDDELLDSFLATFKTDGAYNGHGDSQPVPAQVEPAVIPEPRPRQTATVTEPAPAQQPSPSPRPAGPADEEVSSVAFMVNELQYARLLVQTRLQSLFWRTAKEVQQDTGPVMTELKEFVRSDIIVAAREETHRLMEEARRVSATLPDADEIVDAVVEGLEDANRVTMQVTNDIAQSVSQAVREVLAEEDEHATGAGTTTQPQPAARQDAAPSVAAAREVREEPEEPVSSFSIGSEAREAAHAAEVDHAPCGSGSDDAGSRDDTPAAASDVQSTTDSFVMITNDEGADTDSLLSLVMPEPDVSGDVIEDGDSSTEDAPSAPAVVGAHTSPQPVDSEPTTEEATGLSESVITNERTYHQRAAGVKSSAVIDNLFVLFDMGFKDFETNLSVLTIFRNDLQKTVAELLERQERN